MTLTKSDIIETVAPGVSKLLSELFVKGETRVPGRKFRSQTLRGLSLPQVQILKSGNK